MMRPLLTGTTIAAAVLLSSAIPAGAVTPVEPQDAEWTYYAGIVNAMGEVIRSVPEKVVAMPATPDTKTTPASAVGYASSGVSSIPSPTVSAFATTSFSDTSSYAYSELFYSWRASSDLVSLVSLVRPTIGLKGFAEVSHNADYGYAIAAINSAPAFATSRGTMVGDDSSDTDPSTYRELLFQCGDLSGVQSCGHTDFVMRGMYSFIDDYTIGGYISLRTSAIASMIDDEVNYSYVGPKTASAILDPIITFDADFMAAHPDLKITVSRGLTNGPAASTAVPEPDTWAMMIVGFGLIGSLLRRARLPRRHMAKASV